MHAIVLYGTECCHLCEQAEAMLGAAGVVWQWREVSERDDWLERWADKVPVLHCPHCDAELLWPFDAAAIRHWLDHLPV